MTLFGKWYKDVCSELQCKKEFKEFEVEFDQQDSDKSRFKTLLRYHQIGKYINKCYTSKCDKKSEQHRNLGNKYYSRKEFSKALLSYSKSIAYGLEKSKELPLALANRSVVLYSTKSYELCQLDIELAFDKGYPLELHHKLYERSGRCYFELGNTKKASECLKQGLTSLKSSELDVNKKNTIAHSLIELIAKCDDTISTGSELIPIDNHLYLANAPLIPKEDVNDIYPCASKAFSIIETENEGRHSIATRDIPIGEIIITEKAFSSVCLPSRFETHCYHCLKRFKVSYPCRNCALVNFCSFNCEKNSWDSFHQYECEYLDVFIEDDIGLGHLALKMVVQVGFKALSEMDCEKGYTLGVNEKGIYDPADYKCVYSLVGNSQLRKSSDMFRRSLIALYMCHILLKTGFIKGGAALLDEYLVIGWHLLKQLQMLPCNAHEVSELQLEGNDVANAKLQEIGSAAYTTLSLLNHSCDPSVVRHCYGDVCVLRAVKYIKKGEQIIDNYGHLYPVEIGEERRKDLLDQYFFGCECVACREDWPLYNDIAFKDPEFHCEDCDNLLLLDHLNIPCSKCNYVDKELSCFKDLHEDYQRSMENILNTGEFFEDLPKVLHYSNILSKKAKLPVIHFNNCQEVIKLCFGLQGNFVKLQYN